VSSAVSSPTSRTEARGWRLVSNVIRFGLEWASSVAGPDAGTQEPLGAA